MRMDRRKVVIATVLAALLVLAPLWLMNAYGRAVESDHSRAWTAGSIGEARARGVFVRHLDLTDSTVEWGTRTLRVRDAWVEEQTQVRYTLALPWTRRVERLGTYRLAFALAPVDGDAIHDDERFALVSTLCVVLPNDTVRGLGTAVRADAPFTADVGRDIPAWATVAASPTACPRR
jgi:hypothetical protein